MNKHETQKAALESLQLKYGFCIFQKIPGTRLSALGTPSGLLERPKGSWNRASGSIWNGPPLRGVRGILEPLGTPLGSWNRAAGSIWNARQRIWNHLERAPALLEQSLRLYLERALAQWNPLTPPNPSSLASGRSASHTQEHRPYEGQNLFQVGAEE